MKHARANTDTPVNVSALWAEATSDDDFVFDVRAERLCVDLIRALHHQDMTQSDLASILDWTKGRVSKVLHGHTNLTLRTLHTLVTAMNLDFDIVFRSKEDAACRQPWHEREADTYKTRVAAVHAMEATMRQKLAECSMLLASAKQVNQAAWRRTDVQQAAKKTHFSPNENWGFPIACAAA
ncbi:Predicted transcription regulator containing HTH domain [Bordetella trematum]|uniref:Predicted transcription regulator containing HTH domain n=1 Tax=Bordetella trematum TaxID=123899 RepID=A0A157SK10_9BORD|nr:helix-turn-helix transcriptional regulator [Bordetella trematum]NNH20918.1 helix-turn-helix transcriptional regulator [Bordetella trematum]SAI22344.1 Predicted transcription regulator containing HTH domain [Bordetella trematum]SAI70634.1 Predicted transcription regulator containing HTH domain [Bordetella trematum]SUV98705.1 Predicted transcription regulator containing HTH domain [Bordetella trematum]